MASRKPTGDYERVHLSDRRSWRRWLEKNHAIQRGIWLVFYKKATRKPSLEYEESVEEALCFGWVDSRTRRLDDERYMLMFTPRKPGSPWSRPNKERVERLVASGLMTPPGLAKIEEAQRNGAWTVYDAIEDLVIPDDPSAFGQDRGGAEKNGAWTVYERHLAAALAAALAEGTSAQETFEGFSISVRKNILWWIASARRPETRARRIAKTAAAVAENRNPL